MIKRSYDFFFFKFYDKIMPSGDFMDYDNLKKDTYLFLIIKYF